jgi:hypothetical protein
VHNVQISRTDLDKVRDSLEDFCAGSYADVAVRHDYSGRGMYGATCIGVESSDTAAPAAFLYLVAETLGLDFLEFLGDLGPGESDSMGLSAITYWRGLTLLDEA